MKLNNIICIIFLLCISFLSIHRGPVHIYKYNVSLSEWQNIAVSPVTAEHKTAWLPAAWLWNMQRS